MDAAMLVLTGGSNFLTIQEFKLENIVVTYKKGSWKIIFVAGNATYKSPCQLVGQSVRRSVGRSVGPSVDPSIHPTLLFRRFWAIWR